MEIKYDAETDILNINFSSSSDYEISESIEFEENSVLSDYEESFFLDLDKEKKICGLEIHFASEILPRKFLENVKAQ